MISYKVIKLSEAKLEVFGSINRRVLYSPSLTGNKLIKMAYVSMEPGAVSPIHLHLGEESVYTLKGSAVCTIGNKKYILKKDTAFIIPPNTPHPVKVISKEPWEALCTYCDECPVLKKAIREEYKL